MRNSIYVATFVGVFVVIFFIYSLNITGPPIYVADYAKLVEDNGKEVLRWTPSAAQEEKKEEIHEAIASLKDPFSSDLYNESNSYILMQLMADSLQMLPNKERPKPHSLQIVIAATWRSGSTFLEQFLSSHNGALDFYEPLLQFEFDRLQEGETRGEEAKKLIHDILNCRIDNEEYFKTGRRFPDLFQRNQRIWRICKSSRNTNICYDKNFLQLACELFPFMVMKLVRAGMSLLRPILLDPNLNPHIIFLVRDPRATFNSRMSTVKWCTKPICSDPSIICQAMEKDLNIFLELEKQFPGKLHIVRYEDISLAPLKEAQKLVQRIGWDFSSEMEEFLSSHTTEESDTPWTTKRRSAERVMHWTKVMKFSDVERVQRECLSIMKRLGYVSISSMEGISLKYILEPLSLPRR